MTSTPARHALAALLSAALAAVLAAGCGEEEPDLPTPVAPVDQPATEATPTSTADPEEAKAVDEVLLLYDGYLQAHVAFATSEEPPVGALELELLNFAEATFLEEPRNQVVQNYIDGLVFAGDLTWELAEVVDVDLEHAVDGETVPRVVFRVCLDASGWQLVERDTAEPVGDPPGRYLSTVTAEWRDEREFGPEGWGLHEQDDNDRSEPC